MPLEPQVTVNFSARPIGQGLFTHAVIHLAQQDPYRIVYDCGAEPPTPLLREIANLRWPQLDLLIVSHFHLDHVSGLHELLQSTHGAREAWVPYVAPQVRVWAAMRAIASCGGECDDWVIRFILDPATALGDAGVGTIVTVGVPPEDGVHKQRGNVPPQRDDDLERRPLDPDTPVLRTVSIEHEYGFQIAPADGMFGVELRTWMRPFANAPLVRKRMDHLIMSETGILSPIPERGYLNEDAIQLLLPVLRSAGSRRGSLPRLQKLYPEFDGHLNDTSLVLLVRRIPSVPPRPYRLDAQLPDGAYLGLGWHDSDGILFWCGDIETGTIRLMLQDADDRLRAWLRGVAIWQVPHHGARSSDSKDLRELLASRLACVSHGEPNRHRHPSAQVVSATRAHRVTNNTREMTARIQW